MNYSLVGKARISAKNQIRAKKAHCANIATYANREANRTPKVLVFAGRDLRGGMICKWVNGDVNRPLRVI